MTTGPLPMISADAGLRRSARGACAEPAGKGAAGAVPAAAEAEPPGEGAARAVIQKSHRPRGLGGLACRASSDLLPGLSGPVRRPHRTGRKGWAKSSTKGGTKKEDEGGSRQGL